MSERSERLFEALSKIDEGKIDEAAPTERKKQFHWKRWAAVAAALVLVVGVGRWILPRLGDSAGKSGTGGSGADGASTFMSYAGPVFPLTLKEADSAITAEREITLDFATWVDQQHPTDIQVSDTYTLTNTSSQDKTISLLYPFTGELWELEEQMPTLTAGGNRLTTTLHAGGYSGGFIGTGGAESEERWNLAELNSWEQYKILLADGSYQQGAFEDYPDLSDIPAIVYEFTDPQGDGTRTASIQSAFELDFGKTQVLSYGFNGMSSDQEGGWMGMLFDIPMSWEYNGPRYLIVLGDDVWNMTIQGYANVGRDERDFTVTVRRYETSLEDILREVAQQRYNWQEVKADFVMFFGLMKENLTAYGILSEDPAERYIENRLEDLDFHGMDRVFYLETEITIPAGENVIVEADMTKESSYDFYCVHTENQGVYGYDMVTKLGSNLICTQQTALLENRGQIEIVRQNFGFDLENNISKVTLDPDQEHYYLEVKGREVQPGK